MLMIRRGSKIGKLKIANNALFEPARAIIPAIKVETTLKPTEPRNKEERNNPGNFTSKLNQKKNRGTITTSTKNNKTKLNKNFDQKIIPGLTYSFNAISVFCSTSLTKTWESPVIDEKNIIIQKNEAPNFSSNPKGPIEKLTALKVITANKIIALIEYLVLNSSLKSF